MSLMKRTCNAPSERAANSRTADRAELMKEAPQI